MQTITKITLDTQNAEKLVRVHAKQGDQGSRYISVSVTENGKPFVVDTDMQARMRCLRKDGAPITTDAAIQTGGTILARIPDEAMALPGMVLADITLFDPEGTFLSTMVFAIQVKDAPLGSAEDPDPQDLNALLAALARLDATIAKTELVRRLVDNIPVDYRELILDVADLKEDLLLKADKTEVADVESQLSESIAELQAIEGNMDYGFSDEPSFIVNSSGNLIAGASQRYVATDYLDCSVPFFVITYADDDNSGHAFYDANKVFIAGSGENDAQISGVLTRFEAPVNAKYVRFSCLVSFKDKFKFAYVDEQRAILKVANLESAALKQTSIAAINPTLTNGKAYNVPNGKFYDSANAATTETPIEYTGGMTVVVCDAKYQYRLYGSNAIGTAGVEITSGYTGNALDISNFAYKYMYFNVKYRASAPITEDITGAVRIEKHNTELFNWDAKIRQFGVNPYYFTSTANSPTFAWIDDDTTIDGITSVKNIADNKGVKLTFACIGKRLDEVSGLESQLLQYQEEGHQITAHSFNHSTGVWNASTQSETDLSRDIAKCISVMQKKGFLNCDEIVAPFGSVTDTAVKVYAKYGRCAVLATGSDEYNVGFGQGRYKIGRLFIRKDTHPDMGYYANLIDEAIRNNALMVFGTHSGDASQFDANLVGRILDYVQSKGYTFCTLHEAMQKRKTLYDIHEIFS